jgi:hypothetical protein
MKIGEGTSGESQPTQNTFVTLQGWKKFFSTQQKCFIIFNAVLLSELPCWFQMHKIAKKLESSQSRPNKENTKQKNIDYILVPIVYNPCIQSSQINSSLSHTDLTGDEG